MTDPSQSPATGSDACGHGFSLDSFTTECPSPPSDDSFSDSDSGSVGSKSSMYQSLKNNRIKKDPRDLVEKEKMKLESEMKKLEKMKDKQNRKKHELEKWESKLEEFNKNQQDNRRLLDEADREFEQQMKTESVILDKEYEELCGEIAEISNQMKELDKDRQLKSRLLEISSDKIAEIRAISTSLQRSFDEFQK